GRGIWGSQTGRVAILSRDERSGSTFSKRSAIAFQLASRPLLFPIKKPTFALNAPRISGQRPVVSNNPMAWDRHRNIVGCACSCDGPNSLRGADLVCEVGV